MKKSKSPYDGFRVHAAVISCAVRWYYCFSLSFHDTEELLDERSVGVSYESVRNWCDRFDPQFACRAKAARARSGSTWHTDELFVTLRGAPHVLWSAVDENGAELDILLQRRRDRAPAELFFKRMLRSHPVRRKIVTDRLRSYAAARLNNRAENSRQPTHRREHQIQGFRDPRGAHSTFSPVVARSASTSPRRPYRDTIVPAP
ncbi:hypothetical protein R75465_08018 [Paraburkholderia aspalathi]|nr:hypothetical protein R75465_08018 [Paraburkholderia aspalathi]